MLKLSSRVEQLRPSATLEISAKAGQLRAEGKDVISLAAGEPDFNTPESIRHAATEAMDRGITRYTPAPGLLALREALASKITKENKISVTPSDIAVTVGAKHALYSVLQCLCDPGDVVLVPTPAWVSYNAMVELAGGKVLPLPLLEEDGFCPNVDRWKGMAIPPNTRGIIINSPNNPTGAVYSKQVLTQLVSWALQRNLWIISDEVYEKILYDAAEHVSVASLGPEVAQHTITICSVSKTYSMTGWRLGWATGPQPLIKKLSALLSQSTSNVTSFVQMAGIRALDIPQSEIDPMVALFKGRRQYVMKRLDALKPMVSYVPPSGAFYFFVNLGAWLKEKQMNDMEFATRLIDEAHVGVVPGTAFGREGYVRLSYATSDENLAKAFDRIEAFLRA